MPGSILVVTFDTATGLRTGRLIGSTLLEAAAVVSGKIGSGIIGAIHFAPFTSGYVVLGQGAGVTPVYGFPPAGVPGDETITSAKLTSGAVIGDRIAYAGIFSGRLASGAVGTAELLGDQIVASAKIAANVIATPHIANQGLLSSVFGANVIATPHITNQGILSASFGAGAIGGAHVANQGLISANFATGVIGHALVTDYGIISGKVASGAITEQGLASGISIDIAETSIEPGYRAKQGISGLACVYIAAMSGNYVDTALAISGYMPAIGITLAPIASGQLGNIIYAGRAAAPSSVVSGQYRKQVFVGASGQLTLTPPSATGNCQQIIGVVKDDDEVMLFPEPGYIEIA